MSNIKTNVFFFFISTGATWYYHAIFVVIIYFELFTDYEDDIFKVIFNLHIQLEMWGSKSSESKQNMFWDFLNGHKLIWSMKKNKKPKGYDQHAVDPPPTRFGSSQRFIIYLEGRKGREGR